MKNCSDTNSDTHLGFIVEQNNTARTKVTKPCNTTI